MVVSSPFCEWPPLSICKVHREFAQPLDQHFEEVGETEQEAPDGLDFARLASLAGRMVLLVVAKRAVAVATDRRLFVAESAAGDVMQLKRQRIIVPAYDAARVVASQPFERPLLAALPFSSRSFMVYVLFKQRCGRCARSSDRERMRAGRARLGGFRMGASFLKRQ